MSHGKKMKEFKVIECQESHAEGDRKYRILAINFLEPTLVETVSEIKIPEKSIVNYDGQNLIFEGKVLGKVTKEASGRDVSISTDYDIKYTGGYSLDGKTIYLDEHFPRTMSIEGKDVNSSISIGLHHELPEKWLSDEGFEYPYAHEIATGIEKEYVESLGITWKGYCDEVDRNLRKVYRNQLKKSPPSLDLSPYLYCRDREALKEIRESK